MKMAGPLAKLTGKIFKSLPHTPRSLAELKYLMKMIGSRHEVNVLVTIRTPKRILVHMAG